MSTYEPKRRRAGRPKDNSEDRRKRLIEAAGPIFSQRGYVAAKIPELAKAADVTPAMVHYYFGGKDGLLQAVFDAAFTPLIEKLDQPSTLEEWVITFHDHLLGRRWIPHLLIREVIMESGHLRDHFVAAFAPRILAKWLSLFAHEKAGGRMRADADDLRHTVLIMGMLVYPFVVAPLSGILSDSPFGDEQMRQFRDDAVRLFFKGARG
ncbi:TetR/AcrR family transcriptional regulator [Kordiimonas sp.]|uniref:TetR/AcrR family transcriptional regulator n=1 Tax=Kordiimonas sp. TaxID=1970157 RepID=UPI003A909B01